MIWAQIIYGNCEDWYEKEMVKLSCTTLSRILNSRLGAYTLHNEMHK